MNSARTGVWATTRALARRVAAAAAGTDVRVGFLDHAGPANYGYAVFGKVTSGMDVVEAIAQTQTKSGGSGEKSTPVEPITLQKVTIAES